MSRRFRKKPVVVEAEQWDGVRQIRGVCYCGNESGAHVHTTHEGQTVRLQKGDWILPEPDGVHFYPVKPDIFAANYEEVPE